MTNLKCPKCGGEKITVMTRITGYFSKLQNWSKSKLAELQDREKGNYTVEESKDQ
jgi:anaerobic ribonucleoside-triphosphate reductase